MSRPKYVASCSGGKDSVATLLLAAQHNEPLDEAVFSEVMFDKDTSGEVPEHRDFIYDRLKPFCEKELGIKFLGDRAALDPKLQKLMNELEGDSASKTGMTLNIAVNYGGRPEIVRAAQQLAARVAAGELKPEEITEEMMSDHMYTAGQKDPDFILRPSGEKRLSNFMLWQAAYSELVEMDVLWPDFTRDDLDAAITEFNKRSRRFGGI